VARRVSGREGLTCRFASEGGVDMTIRSFARSPPTLSRPKAAISQPS